MSSTRTVPTTEVTQTAQQPTSDAVLRLTSTQQPSTSTGPRVTWRTDTVDNEFLSKKKSKCCCIYKKPRNWQDSSSGSDSDCETGHCRGHVEKKKQHHHHHDHDDSSPPGPPVSS